MSNNPLCYVCGNCITDRRNHYVLVGENLTCQNLLPVASSPRPLINSCADGGLARGKRKKGLVNGLELIWICTGMLTQPINYHKLHS